MRPIQLSLRGDLRFFILPEDDQRSPVIWFRGQPLGIKGTPWLGQIRKKGDTESSSSVSEIIRKKKRTLSVISFPRAIMFLSLS